MATNPGLSSSIVSTSQELWYDTDKNQHYILKDGESIPCNSMGNPVKHFVLYGSGHYDYNARVKYSSETSTAHMLPVRPQSLSEAGAKRLYHPTQYKFNGYTQFPRPLSNVFFNASQDEWKTKYKTASKELKRTRLKSQVNQRHLKDRRDPRLTCTFFSQRNPASTMRCAMSPKAATNKNEETNEIRPLSCLPQRPLMFGSTLKTAHMDRLRGTFSNFRNLKGVSEDTLKHLSGIAENYVTEPATKLCKTFKEITTELKREERDMEGYKPPIVKEKRIPIKGIYSIRMPTEGELYNKALERRKQVNPVAWAEEARREQIDKMLMEKHRNQRILKNKAMESMVKAKEKALLKEITNKNK